MNGGRSFENPVSTMRSGANDDSRDVGSRMPGLRYDKVALRLIAHVQTALREHVPQGKALLVTVSAPIRLPAKTASELEERLRLELSGGSKPDDIRTTINDNAIRVRMVDCDSNQTPNVFGFVHNPEVDTLVLLDAEQSILTAGCSSLPVDREISS